jgi:hypothetical protein
VGTSGPPRRPVREDARRLLAAWDLDAVARWAAGAPGAVAALQRALFDDDETTRWRAVEALGVAAGAVARAAPERARELVRRILWLMNDESGGVLWSGPQVVGAVLARVPALRAELAPVLASFLDEEPFRTGTRWALWRVAVAAPDAVRCAEAGLRASLADPDPAVRGHAALALAAAGAPARGLEADLAPFRWFDPRTGELRPIAVASAARGAA